MSTFTFNSVSSDTLGLIITRPMIRPTWQPETEFTPIIGRPRQNPFTKSWFPNSRISVSAVIADASPANVRTIYDKLRGYGELVISTSPDEYVNAYARLPVPEAQALLMAELPIEFECEPFAYSNTVSTVNITNATSYLDIENEGTAFVDPVITYVASAASTTFLFNGKTITITTPAEIVEASYSSSYSITLDCDAQLAYYTKPNSTTVGCTQLTSGPFPRMHTGTNYISHSGITAGQLSYRERWY